MEKLVDLLESEEFNELLRRNRTGSYIDTGNIFLLISTTDFKISNNESESIFSFIAARQDYDKKLMQITMRSCCKQNLIILKTTISTLPSFSWQ